MIDPWPSVEVGLRESVLENFQEHPAHAHMLSMILNDPLGQGTVKHQSGALSRLMS